MSVSYRCLTEAAGSEEKRIVESLRPLEGNHRSDPSRYGITAFGFLTALLILLMPGYSVAESGGHEMMSPAEEPVHDLTGLSLEELGG